MASGTMFRRPAVLLALGLCAFGGVVTLLGRLAGGPPVEQKRSMLTVESGVHAYPAFSPDGKRVAYSGHGPGKNDTLHIYVRPSTTGAATQLTRGDANDVGPVWSPDGSTLAFLRLDDEQAQCILIPAAGGVERKIAEFDAPASSDSDEVLPVPGLSWMHDGKSLAVTTPGEKKQPTAISVLAIDSGKMHRITNPPAGSQGDSQPVMSPDGATLAFVRSTDTGRADIYLADAGGANPRQLTFDGNTIRGIAWTPGGHDIVYAADRGSNWRLWRVPAYGGSPRDLQVTVHLVAYPAVAPAGNLMAFMDSPSLQEIWRAQFGSGEDLAEEHPVARSPGREFGPALSPDGSRFANISDQSGDHEVWLTDASGKRTQLTRLQGPRMRQPRWSPDGATLLFETRGQRGAEIYKVPASENGKPVRVMGDAMEPSWSRDGKSFYYVQFGSIWKAAADGSSPKRLTERNGDDPQESADGKYVFYRWRRSIWRAPADGGEGEELFVPEHDMFWQGIVPVKDGLYYLEFDRGRRGVMISYYSFADKKSRPVAKFRNTDPGSGYSISPDEKWLLYSKVDRNETNLTLLEGFR